MNFRKNVIGAFAAALFFAISSAHAVPTTSLYLVIDASSSLDGAACPAGEFCTEVKGTRDALEALLPIDGSVAIGALLFGSTQNEFVALGAGSILIQRASRD